VKLPELEHRYPTTMPTRLTIRTSKGVTYSRQVDQPLGHPGHPLSDQEVEDKLRRLASRRITPAQITRLLDFVWTLEERKDIATLMPLLKVRS
jgi:2-methylcitrate dehydratase